MEPSTKRKTYATLDAGALDIAKALESNMSAVAEVALKRAVVEAKHNQWLVENAQAFAAQVAWHERHGHPLADIICARGAGSWNH